MFHNLGMAGNMGIKGEKGNILGGYEKKNQTGEKGPKGFPGSQGYQGPRGYFIIFR